MQALLQEEREWYPTLYERRWSVDGGVDRVGILFSPSWLYWKALWDDDITWNGLDTTGADASMLLRWYGHVQDAYTAISIYKKSDPALYNTLYKRIQLEGIPVRYMLAWLFKDTTYGTMEDIYNDCVALGMTYFSEGISLEDKEIALEYMNKGHSI